MKSKKMQLFVEKKQFGVKRSELGDKESSKYLPRSKLFKKF